MYPETDAESIIITKQMLSKIKIPETWEQKAKRFNKILPRVMVDQVLRSEYLDSFEKLSKDYDPVLGVRKGEAYRKIKYKNKTVQGRGGVWTSKYMKERRSKEI